MVKRLLYKTLRVYLNVGLFFFFRKVMVSGIDNIPKSGPVIFVANHQNAILDGVLVASATHRTCHFLTRADIFVKPLYVKLLSLINSMPVYRFRDGFENLGQNARTFDRCYDVLMQNECIVIFPEGNHSFQRRLRKLTKGFARIVFGAMKKYSGLEINIVPVGINYTNHQQFGSSVNILFGKPILASSFVDAHPASQLLKLTDELAAQMKKLITHVEDEENYGRIILKLNKANSNYLHPIGTNERIGRLTEIDEHPPVQSMDKGPDLFFFRYVAWLPNIFPFMAWRLFARKIKDPVFVGSAKFIFGIFVFPVILFLQSLLVGSLAGAIFGTLFFVLSIFSVKVLQKD